MCKEASRCPRGTLYGTGLVPPLLRQLLPARCEAQGENARWQQDQKDLRRPPDAVRTPVEQPGCLGGVKAQLRETYALLDLVRIRQQIDDLQSLLFRSVSISTKEALFVAP